MTRSEFDEAFDGSHVPLSCKNHPDLRWSCKKIAISFDEAGIGRYNGRRHIFFASDAPECFCSSEDLELVLEDPPLREMTTTVGKPLVGDLPNQGPSENGPLDGPEEANV